MGGSLRPTIRFNGLLGGGDLCARLLIGLFCSQRSNVSISVHEHARGQSGRADESELARVSTVRKETFAPAQHDRVDEQQNPVDSPCSSSTEVSVELPQTIRSGPSFDLTPRTPSRMSAPRCPIGPHPRLSGRWVATYFIAEFRPSAIGLLPAFGQ